MRLKDFIEDGTLKPNGLVDLYDSNKGSQLFWLWLEIKGTLITPDELHWVMWKAADSIREKYSHDCFRNVVDTFGEMINEGTKGKEDWVKSIYEAEQEVVRKGTLNETDSVVLLLRWDTKPTFLINNYINTRKDSEKAQAEIAEIFRQAVTKESWVDGIEGLVGK